MIPTEDLATSRMRYRCLVYGTAIGIALLGVGSLLVGAASPEEALVLLGEAVAVALTASARDEQTLHHLARS